MREILFRGQSIDRRKWYEGDLYQTRLKSVFYINYYTEHGDRMAVEVDPETVGQYTGLTDKNGTKIFEGDIVKATYHHIRNGILSTVVFENGTFKLSVFGNVKDGEFSFIYSSNDEDKKTSKYAIENNFIFRDYLLEVIGNIHDNPELLKGGVE